MQTQNTKTAKFQGTDMKYLYLKNLRIPPHAHAKFQIDSAHTENAPGHFPFSPATQ